MMVRVLRQQFYLENMVWWVCFGFGIYLSIGYLVGDGRVHRSIHPYISMRKGLSVCLCADSCECRPEYIGFIYRTVLRSSK